MKIAASASKSLFKLIVMETVDLDYICLRLSHSKEWLPRHYVVYGDLLLDGISEDVPSSLSEDLSTVPWERLNQRICDAHNPHYTVTTRSDEADDAFISQQLSIWKRLLDKPILIRNAKSMEVGLQLESLSFLSKEHDCHIALDLNACLLEAKQKGINVYDYLHTLAFDKILRLDITDFDSIEQSLIDWCLSHFTELSLITLTLNHHPNDESKELEVRIKKDLQRLDQCLEGRHEANKISTR